MHTLQQLDNIGSHDMLDGVLQSGVLRLHAMWYCVSTGDVFFFEKEKGKFAVINEQVVENLLSQP